MEEWKEYKLEEAISFKNGKKRNNTEGCFPIYGGNGILGYSNETNYENCVIIGRVGAYCGSVFYEKSSCWVSDNAISAMPKEGFDTQFCYYLLSQLQLNKRCIGTGQPLLTQEILNRITVNLPPLPTQQKIAQILSSLDDKIELNNKINANLEQQAQALFKSWFVDFEPFGGEMPAGWKVGKLSDFCNFQEGYVNPAQTHNEYFDGDVKWLRAVDINESFILDTSRTLTKEGFESAGKSAFLFKPGSIAISKSGTVGRLGIISDYMCGNRAVIGIEIKEPRNLSYVHQYMKSRQEEFPDMAVGSVQKNLYVSILENLDITIPSNETLTKFVNVCSPIYEQIKNNCIENKKLSNLRDTLLPKLMNGEIEM